jgi:hypothetical protein
MHTRNTLHLNDQQLDLIENILSTTQLDITDDFVVELLVNEGIMRYPAEQVIQYRKFYLSQELNGSPTPLRHGRIGSNQAA